MILWWHFGRILIFMSWYLILALVICHRLDTRTALCCAFGRSRCVSACSGQLCTSSCTARLSSKLWLSSSSLLTWSPTFNNHHCHQKVWLLPNLLTLVLPRHRLIHLLERQLWPNRCIIGININISINVIVITDVMLTQSSSSSWSASLLSSSLTTW